MGPDANKSVRRSRGWSSFLMKILDLLGKRLVLTSKPSVLGETNPFEPIRYQ